MRLLDTVTLRSDQISSCHRGQALSPTSHRPSRALHSSSRLKLGSLAKVKLSLLSLSQKILRCPENQKARQSRRFSHSNSSICQRYYPFLLDSPHLTKEVEDERAFGEQSSALNSVWTSLPAHRLVLYYVANFILKSWITHQSPAENN